MPTPFCSLTDVANTGLPASAFGVLTTQQKQAAVDRANAWIGAALAGRYPGINQGGAGWTWDESVTGAAVDLACEIMLDTRGRQPSLANADKSIDEKAARAREWIVGVQTQKLHPYITGSEAAGSTSQGPVLLSRSNYVTNGYVSAKNRGIQ